ncbi:PIN domain-containing protein [Pseudarthrobacter sp. NPDC058329]|uniref:PIN domain-containing protein n=1 Tax=Pseudarthrobacter sp. NPDC058329 TaxID=3346448 RepID=UPI0036DDE937
MYARSAVASELYTDRYWQVRAIDDQSDSPHGLIRGEVQGQYRHIFDLAQQLERYQRLLAAKEGQRLVLCDTNVFIHGMMFDQLPWSTHFAESDVCLIFPLVIIDELDSLKDRGNLPGRTAGRVLRKIDMLLDQHDAFARMQRKGATVSVQLVDEPFGYARFPGNDDEIVRQAGYFASMSGNKLTLVSRDRGMRIRAAAAGVSAMALSPEFEKAKEDNE